MAIVDDWLPSDTSGLTDADWAEINKLHDAYVSGGEKALLKALQELMKDPVRCARVIAAYKPEKMRESLKDTLADAGVTTEDLEDLRRKFEGSRH